MRLEKLNSYPTIAAVAVVVSLLVGAGLGSLNSGVSVVPTVPESPPAVEPEPEPVQEAPSERRAPPRDRKPRDEPPREVEPPPSDESEAQQDAAPENGPRKVAGPRQLVEGRVDPIVEGDAPESASGAIEVTVSDSKGRRLPAGKLALDVRAGPLGWHAVPLEAQHLREQRGVFRFHPLYPGEYRVRSVHRNYRHIEKTVAITHASDVRHVDLTLETLGRAEVEFRLKLEDGTVPELVELSILRGGQQDSAGSGRFGRHETAAEAARGTVGAIPPTNMRFRPDRSGVAKLTLNTGVATEITFTHRSASGAQSASVSVDPPPGLSREDVTLRPVEGEETNSPLDDESFDGRLKITLTLNGEPGEFTGVTLRRAPDDYTYRNAKSSDGGTYVFESVAGGTWYVVAESREFHAPFVRAVKVGRDSTETIDIRTGTLRVTANREPGSPDPEGEMRYRVRLCPMGSGTIESAYNGDLTGKDSDYIDFNLPDGEYTVRVDSPENYANLAVLTGEQSLSMTAGGEEALEFEISAGASLSFVAVDGNGRPVPGVEFLVSFHPAGEVPEDEKSSVRKGGYDGVCKLGAAPFGPVYVHVWTSGSDWNNPDHVFQIDLPAYSTKDMGAVVVE